MFSLLKAVVLEGLRRHPLGHFVLPHRVMKEFDYALREPAPPGLTDKSTAEAKLLHEKWEKANRMALMFIKNSISPIIRGAIPDLANAKAYFTSMEEQFRGTSKAHASTLIMKLVSTKYEGVSGIREHILMMNDMARKLRGLDMEISDGFLVHFIMTSLPASYEAFKINYNTHKEKWLMNELIAMCVQEEERQKLDKPDVAYLMATSSKKRKTILIRMLLKSLSPMYVLLPALTIPMATPTAGSAERQDISIKIALTSRNDWLREVYRFGYMISNGSAIHSFAGRDSFVIIEPFPGWCCVRVTFRECKSRRSRSKPGQSLIPTKCKNPTFRGCSSNYTSDLAGQMRRSVVLLVKEVESFTWTPRTPKSVKKRASYRDLKLGNSRERVRKCGFRERKGWLEMRKTPSFGVYIPRGVRSSFQNVKLTDMFV
ncbi:hypothetical protein E3N88_19586 [Mikania micrantha]|uniref:UBN2_2 domain-containing protein n=1 Tax=Mikania micrantha TaxID=192012 RepID=A0A5N6NQA1_9ASTR|nr:hypothetical protein E3N88_19586 [Mikania micrantha]